MQNTFEQAATTALSHEQIGDPELREATHASFNRIVEGADLEFNQHPERLDTLPQEINGKVNGTMDSGKERSNR